MKLFFVYGRFSIGSRAFDLQELYTSPRGLTGSELSFFEYALAMKARGHDVSIALGQDLEPTTWQGMKVHAAKDPKIVADADAVLAWNEPDMLRELPDGPLRVVNQQLNDFAYCKPNWEKHCDLVTSPSGHHLEFLKKQAPDVKAWGVLPNGCDPTQYEEGHRVSGRVIWASSGDRGLHRLLEVWPRIKEKVPHASLRCFYNFQPAHFDEFEQVGQNVHPDLLEIAQRKRYIRYAMSRFMANPEKWDVEHVGSVGRKRMKMEFEHAQVLGYPCDTIRYTEGFSVTTMEACASGCLPVITDIDSLGHIYGEAAPTIKLGGGAIGDKHLDEFVDLVVRGLTDDAWRAEKVASCRALAARYAWPVLAEKLESMLASAIVLRNLRQPTEEFPANSIRGFVAGSSSAQEASAP